MNVFTILEFLLRSAIENHGMSIRYYR